MKKKLVFSLAALGAASMLCGFDSAETADGLLTKMQEASSAANGVSMDMKMNLDASVNMSDGTTTSTLAMVVGADFGIDATMDPLAMKMDGSMKISALGQGQEVAMKMYGVTNENNEMETYIYTEDSTTGESGWEYESSDVAFDMDEMMELSKSFDPAMYAEWGLVFELAPEAADVNGTECYVLSAVIDSSSMNTLLSKASELTGEDLSSDPDVALALSYLDGLKLNLQYYVDTATYLPVSMHMDMAGSDLTTINALLASELAGSAEGTSVELVLNDASIDVTTAYGDVEAITVPEEAIAAVAADEADEIDD